MELTGRVNVFTSKKEYTAGGVRSYSLTQWRMNFDGAETILTNHDRLHKDGRRTPRTINRLIGEMTQMKLVSKLYLEPAFGHPVPLTPYTGDAASVFLQRMNKKLVWGGNRG